ncbi:MAG: hypothetical protein Dbin4_02477 [Alphaproteobacteria bacterium]|nr:hypothetical protein [Alphaproteobacteria bacterium]
MAIRTATIAGLLMAGLFAGFAWAEVPAEVAARLGQDLTPLGSQKSGNKDGTIPEWTGGLAEIPAHVTYKAGDRYPDPYAADTPLYTITSANMAQYADKLTEVSASLFKTYPDAYKMNVYPTRRSCANPPSIYEANKKSAQTSTISPSGDGFTGAINSLPFPIASNANELIFNQRLQYRGYKITRQYATASPTRSGEYSVYTVQDEVIFPWNDPSITSTEQLNNIWAYYINNTIAPARAAGNVVLIHDTIDAVLGARKAWVYSPGTRRVRRAPNIGYDNPSFNDDGLSTIDQFNMFNGALDRYDWSYNGRSEAIISYNNYRLASADVKYSDLFKPSIINQDYPRYELHRNNVITANLRSGTRHIYSKRVFWQDEDSFNTVASSNYDARGKVWRVHEQFPYVHYGVPACNLAGSVVYDLNAGRYTAQEFFNEEPSLNHFADELTLERYTPDYIRRVGVR